MVTLYARGGSGMTELERRYARVLRLHPAAYRQGRGAEMLAVLMDAAPPHRHRPQWREVSGLVLGALRVHAGSHLYRSAGQSWRAALRIVALMLLVKTVGDALWHTMADPARTGAVVSVRIMAGGLAIVAVLRGADLTATVLIAGAFALNVLMVRAVDDLPPLRESRSCGPSSSTGPCPTRGCWSIPR
jgi:hypothetical protein